MAKCVGCGGEKKQALWNLGTQPLSFEFQPDAVRFLLNLMECLECGLIQLEEEVSQNLLNTMPDWVKYKEPENHLRELMDYCRVHEVWSEEYKILGLTSHDSPLLTLVSETEKLLIDQPLKGVRPNPWKAEETIDQMLADECHYDVIIARRILEHFENPHRVLLKLRNLGTQLLLEIPDSTKSLEQGDVTMLWEEHKCYFTASSLTNLLAATGWNIKSEWEWADVQEDTRCVLVEQGTTRKAEAVNPDLGTYFINQVQAHRLGLHALLSNSSSNAIFGVGHRSVAFLHYHQLDKYIGIAYDDHEMKRGRTLPGSSIPIQSTNTFDPDTAICLLAMGASAMEQVRENYSLRYPRTQFISILPDSHFFGLVK